MMKILTLTLAMVLTLTSLNANATQYKFIAADRSIETKMCVYAGNNNTVKLKRAIQYHAMGSTINTKRFAVNNITCNDLVMAHFAHKYDASDTFKFLNRFTAQKNKIPTTSVEIKDVAAVLNSTNEETQIIYVSSTK
ncbi:DUF3718 domain-containing protein [Litorilituus lipolyticus]|uniref:DUF3718 domain-containing protein n=1 Tax=Litorilituus lipolyticus TaxID=2491017 RepID=A0A502KP31_9GAMM|nr:DUF3718 domain-containing protein [Litorilituus lipolyticus]TPH13418.1 DUF3718 domain-containing protein [Litorilituus lipolyticus]